MIINTEITCLSLEEPENGGITYSNDTQTPFDFGTTATYICIVGFGLTGEISSRICAGDDSTAVGKWTEETPMCKGMSMFLNAFATTTTWLRSGTPKTNVSFVCVIWTSIANIQDLECAVENIIIIIYMFVLAM